MNDKNKNSKESTKKEVEEKASGKLIDFSKQKAVHAHELKEKKLKAMQEAFKLVLPLKKTKTKNKAKNRKGKKKK